MAALRMSPLPGPAVNIKGDLTLGWGLAWASGSQGPARGSWEEVELSTLSFQLGLCEAQFCARRPWSHSVIFLPCIAVHGSPRRQPWSWAKAPSHACVSWPWILLWGLAKPAPVCYPLECPLLSNLLLGLACPPTPSCLCHKGLFLWGKGWLKLMPWAVSTS